MATEPQIINILGEQVSLEKTSFSPSEKFLVSFDTKYKYPGMSYQEEVVLKKLFQKLFSASSPFLPGQKQPLPPCSDKEKELLLQSLLYRFNSLRNELIAERKSTSDSLRLRQLVDHVQRIKDYIDFLETTTSCKELDEDLLAESVGDLTDEQIVDLLKQFVFFMLQGKHPLDPFKGRDPNPKGFVARLSQKPVKDFDDFMDQYRAKKYTVPLPIDKVLQVTQLDLQAMRGQLQQGFQGKIQEILQPILDVFPAEDPFWENLDKTNINAIVDKLLENIQQLKLDLDDCTQQSERDQSIIVDLNTEIERLGSEINILQTKVEMMGYELKATQAENDETGSNKEEMEEYSEDALQRIKALQQRIQELERKNEEVTNQLAAAVSNAEAHENEAAEKAQLLQRLQNTEEEVLSLKEKLATLEAELEEANGKVKACEELQSKVAILEKQVQDRNTQLTELRARAGELTLKIDENLQEKAKLVEERDELKEALLNLKEEFEKFRVFLNSLEQDKSFIITMLDSIQRSRANYVNNDDSILQNITGLSEELQASESIPSDLSSRVTKILQDLEEEIKEKEFEIVDLQSKIDLADKKMEAATEQMAQSNELLQQIRNGRIAMQGKGLNFETDKDMLEAAFKAIEAEKELQNTKKELEETVATLNKENTALQRFITALEARLQGELEEVQTELAETKTELQSEKETTGTLRKDIYRRTSELEGVRRDAQAKDAELQEARETLEREQEESLRRISELEEKHLRDCEERLDALRQEEQAKRDEMISAQGAEKGSLEGRMKDLLARITSVEAERDKYKAELEVAKNKSVRIGEQLEELQDFYTNYEKEMKGILDQTELEKEEAVGEAIRLQGQVVDLTQELEELKTTIISDGIEKEKLFELVGRVATWITSGNKAEKPVLDTTLNEKYGLNRVLDAILESLPKEVETKEGSDSITSSLSRCYLVFFMSFVYARHFPLQLKGKQDADASYQSEFTGVVQGMLSEIYKQMEIGIPGKLEPVGSAGIPIQLKSKYLMNMLLLLVKQMELVHESGKKGADFVKFDLLDENQLKLLHTVHKILADKIRLAGANFLTRLSSYAGRRSGNTGSDLEYLYLRFYHETKTGREYPVILYSPPSAKDIPKTVFATEEDFTQFLSSPVEKTGTKLTSSTEKALVSNPVFSFSLVFYLFLFTVKDYLSSVEGELDKAGCPLPQILKSR